MTKFPLKRQNGELFAVGGIGTDITEVRDYQRRLEEANAFLDSVIDNIPVCIFLKEAEGLSFHKVNRALEELLGLTREELLGKNDFDFFPDHQAAFFAAKDREVLNKTKFIDIAEETIDTKFLGQRILNTKKLALDDASGKPNYLIGIAEDITDRKSDEKRLEALSRDLRGEVVKQTEEIHRHAQ